MNTSKNTVNSQFDIDALISSLATAYSGLIFTNMNNNNNNNLPSNNSTTQTQPLNNNSFSGYNGPVGYNIPTVVYSGGSDNGSSDTNTTLKPKAPKAKDFKITNVRKSGKNWKLTFKNTLKSKSGKVQLKIACCNGKHIKTVIVKVLGAGKSTTVTIKFLSKKNQKINHTKFSILSAKAVT